MTKINQEQSPNREMQVKQISQFLRQLVSLWSYGKIFGDGTKLVITDRNLDEDFSPKPTVFLPSDAEVKQGGDGTYICLLKDFFPDVIKIDWKEKNGNPVLGSQEGNTTKTGDAYMKFSWLTVSKTSTTKDHICVVKHEFNKGGKDQEILFPSINKDSKIYTTEFKQKDEHGSLQLQVAQTSAYYTYIFLLIKSMVYFAIIIFSVFKRTGDCGNRNCL